MSAPKWDGWIQAYADAGVSATTPRILYINGIQTTGIVHEQTALMLSQITQRVIIGVYNKTSGISKKGMVLDLLQCLGDWRSSFIDQLGEFGFDAVNAAVDRVRKWTGRSEGPPSNVADDLRQRVPKANLVRFLSEYMAVNNKASSNLFQELHRHLGARQLIVAHSQGNLVTASALWALQTVHGAGGLRNLQVYSIASPVPAWPAGTNFRIKVYGHKNDVVTLADPKNLLGRRSAGDNERLHGHSSLPGIDPHDISVNFFGTNFVSRIRSDLGLGKWEDSREQHQPYKPGDRVHVVNRGESLSLIAKKYYGTPSKWRMIYDRNRDTVGSDPDRISVGVRLIVPE